MKEPQEDVVADLGFLLSIIGILGVFLFSFSEFHEWMVPIAAVLTLLCIPGLLLSLVALCIAKQKRRAKWGAALGLLGCLYVPTILVFMFQAIHENF
jgi:hypothetical protein